jgi:hypothetical protein
MTASARRVRSGARFAAVVAALFGLAGCGDLLQEPDTGTFPAAVTIEPLSGSGQTGAPGAPLAAPLKVRLLDHDGRPIPRLRVEWTPLPGSGEAQPRNSFSDANGIATTTWFLGPKAGTQEIQASVRKGVPMVFEAVAASP